MNSAIWSCQIVTRFINISNKKFNVKFDIDKYLHVIFTCSIFTLQFVTSLGLRRLKLLYHNFFSLLLFKNYKEIIGFSWIIAQFFGENILYTTLLFPILKVKFSVSEIVKNVFKKKVFEITIFEECLLILKTGNSRFVKNVFSETNKSWLMKT